MSSICINALSASIGGGMTYARSLLPYLQDLLPDAILLCSANVSDRLTRKDNVITAQGYWTRGYRRFVWERVHLRALLRAHGVNRLFTPYQVATQPKSLTSICMLRNMEPFFSHQYEYGSASRVRNEMLRQLTRRNLRRADLVIAVSEFARDFAINSLGVPEDKTVRIYHGRDESLLGDETDFDRATRHAIGVGERYVLTAGSVLPYRRVEDVVQAFERRIAPLDPTAKLIIAGTGTDYKYKTYLKSVIGRSRHATAIRFVGHVDRHQMRALYKGCEMFVSASEIEACPNIGIEAMTAGCRIIAADAGPAREIYGDGTIYYTPRNITELATLLGDLWRDEGRNMDLSARARLRSTRFSWAECAENTARILQST